MQSSAVPLHENEFVERVDPKILANQQEKKKTKAYQNPIKLDKNSIKLEKDAFNKNKYYISFNYSSDRAIYTNFYFNASFTAHPKQNES